MKLKVIIFISSIFATPALCIAQTTTEYSQNKTANSYYIKVLDYIKISSPGNGGSVDSLAVLYMFGNSC